MKLRKEVILQLCKGAEKLCEDCDNDPRYDDILCPPGAKLGGSRIILANGRQYPIQIEWVPSCPKALLTKIEVMIGGKFYDLTEIEETI